VRRDNGTDFKGEKRGLENGENDGAGDRTEACGGEGDRGLHDRHLLPRSARDEAGRTLRGMPPAAGVRRSSHGKMPVYGDKDCSACKVHCYSKEMQEKIREMMKYAGPRMLFVHPLLAIRHVHITLRNKKKQKEISTREKG